MADERTVHCPEGHLITVKLRPQYVDGEKITEVTAYSNVPWCELCLEMIMMLRHNPNAFEESSEEP